MPEAFSPDVKIWLEKQHVLMAAESHFRRQWEVILTEVRATLCKDEWLCRAFGSPHDMLQFYRSSWPNRADQVHYEVSGQDWARARGIVDLSLHMEGALPNQAGVCSRIRQLLGCHAHRITRMLAEFSPSMPEEPIHDILKGSIPLIHCDPTVLCQAMTGMMQVESFVDEAILLADKRAVWRSDLVADEMPLANADWWKHYSTATGATGGWEFDKASGRCASPCFICYPGKSNHADGWNILNLQRTGFPFTQFSPGERVYFAVTVRSDAEFEMEFILQANSKGGWKNAFSGPFAVSRVNRWQVVFEEAVVPDIAEYDLSSEGLGAHVRVKAADAPIYVDSIAMGRS